jgi:hypothetical protein
MFCPQCAADYRPEFTRCSDCDVTLLAERIVFDTKKTDTPSNLTLTFFLFTFVLTWGYSPLVYLCRSSSKRALGSVFVLIVLCGCQSGTVAKTQNPFRYDQQIGVANVKRDTNDGCLALIDPNLKPGAKVTLVDQPAELLVNTPGVNEASVVERLSKDCDNDHMASTEISVSGPTYYRIRTAKQWQGNAYAIAIAEPSGSVAVKEGKVQGDLDGDGANESFRVCSSSEGVHYQVWTGEPLQGQPRWHWYVYAGYDTEPTCTEKDYFGPK